jgi:hypothetical protein
MRLYTLPGTKNFADVYGSGAYGECPYDQSGASTCANGAGTSGNAGGGSLTDTGAMISLVVGVAALLLLAVVLVRFWKRPAGSAVQQPKLVEQPVPIESDTGSDADGTQPRA